MSLQLKRRALKLFKYATLCPVLYRTEWYKAMFLDTEHELYPSNHWYRDHEERNFDVVNLGSSSGKWAFDYAAAGVKGMNWAQQPQTLAEDYNLLRNFHSILRRGGYVLVTIMPFTGLNKKTGLQDAMKYLKLGAHEPIETLMLAEARKYAEFPILFKKQAIKALLRYLTGRERKPAPAAGTEAETNPMTEEQLEENACSFVEGWKRQFDIKEWEAPLTPKNLEGRAFRVKLMRRLVDFCTERGYTPVYVIPPVTRRLARYYTERFEELYVYGFLREVGRDVRLLDYSKEPDFCDDSLYFNCFFLNRRGRRLFTRRVMSELGILPKESAE